MFSSVSARVAPVGARRVHVGQTKTRGVSAARSQPPARRSLKSAVLGRGLTVRGSRNSVSNAALIADVVRPTHKVRVNVARARRRSFGVILERSLEPASSVFERLTTNAPTLHRAHNRLRTRTAPRCALFSPCTTRTPPWKTVARSSCVSLAPEW